MTAERDKEIEAIGIILELLKQFDHKERGRIVNYAARWTNDHAQHERDALRRET